MWISNRSPGLIWAQILSCPQFWRQYRELCLCGTHSLLLPLIQNAWWWCRATWFSNYWCKCRSHIRGQIYGGLKATTEYNRVDPIMNRDLIGKYLCTCTFLKGCIQFALQRVCWKSAAYPLFIPIRGYYYPFGPESLASVQIVFLEETEDWIVYKQGSNPVYLLKMSIKLYFS